MQKIKLVDARSMYKTTLVEGESRGECIKKAVGLVATVLRNFQREGVRMHDEMDVRDMINKGNLVFKDERL